MTIPRTSTLDAGPARLDEHARQLGLRVAAEELDADEAACQVLATAVDSGVVRQMCARHHRQLATRWSIDDITGTVTTMLVGYALTNSERPGHLEVARFADGTSSASGWVGKVIGAMRASRILRGMHEDATTRVDLLGDTDPVSTSSAEATALDEHTVDVEDQTRGLPATSATIRLVHASALHQLLGLPPLRSWRLTAAQRTELTHRVNEDPTLARRFLAANRDVSGADDALTSLWSGWSRDDLTAMLEKSTPTRDIPHLLCHAALRPLPRPQSRNGDLARARRRVLDAAPSSAQSAAAAAFDAFLDTEVETHTDFDRIRRPLSSADVDARAASAQQLPARLKEAAAAMGVSDLDLRSGLTALFIDPLPVADPIYFTPTPWRFRS